jgi:hypothetical protein
MQAALRPYVTAGIALVGASTIAVTPVTPSLPGLPVEQMATRLLDSVANIPYNVIADIANIPYYESLALQEYAYALGPAGSTGGVPGWIPPGATVANGGVDPGPDGIEGTADDLYKQGGTGSWYMESTDGNTWGWDNGNWPQLAAISHFILPFGFTLPIAQELQTFAQAEFIAGAPLNCEFECADVLGYLGGWLVFQTPLTSLLSGTNPDGSPLLFPDTVNAFPNIMPVWAGEPAQLNPLVPFQAIAGNLTQDPSQNPIQFPNLGAVGSNLVTLGGDFITDFNPFATGSFVYWGAPTLYSVPAALAGLVQNFTGIPNQFVGIGAWQGFGGEPSWGPTAGPASLLTGLPAGFAYLAQGLFGYLNPGTYLGPNGISLGNTLLRTYASGSLPGSDIVRQLIGMDPAAVLALGNGLPATGSTGSGAGSLVSGLDPASVLALGNGLPGTGSTGSPASGIGSLLGGFNGNLPDFGLPGLSSLPGGDTSANASADTLTANKQNFTLDVDTGGPRGRHAADQSLGAPADVPGPATVADAVKDTPPAPAQGDAVVAPTLPNKAGAGTNLVRNSLSFVPEIGKKSGGSTGGADRAGATISSVVKGISSAVKGALGGGSTGDTAGDSE